MLTTILLGFSGGLPLALVGSTLQAWLARSQIDIATIGQFSLVGLPYAMKFLWAPIIDNISLPFLGHRRGWLAACQVGLFGATFALATINPSHAMGLFSAMALLLAFFSASQDIVIDAYRTEIIEDESELGAGASTYITGYRIAMLVSGGFALGLADHMSWRNVYILMAVINAIGLVTTLFSREPKVVKRKALGVKDSVALPFIEFFQRSGAMEILIFIMVYKLSTLMATALTTKFLVDLGYTNTMIGTVNKGAGLIATILGTLSGGALMAKFGLKRSLWIFGIIQATVGITFCLLARLATGEVSHLKELWLIIIVSLDNYMMGMGTAALTGFMMNFCSRQYTATQYALLTSIMAVSRVILVAHAGTLVSWIGYDLFFISTVPLAIPGLLLLNRYDHWEAVSSKISATVPKFDLGLMFLLLASLICLSSDPIWRWLGHKELSNMCAVTGAVGVLIVVFVGLVRPYLLKPAA